MNERIKELIAESTWVQFAEGVGYKEVFDKERFAKLIVRRAMDYASRNWEHGHLLAEDLRVYFGIEK